MNNKDRERFLSCLESATVRYGALIHVYCPISDHYLLLVETPRGNLSQIMKHVNGAYAGAAHGEGESAVTQPSRRVAKEMKQSTSVRKSVGMLEKELGL